MTALNTDPNDEINQSLAISFFDLIMDRVNVMKDISLFLSRYKEKLIPLLLNLLRYSETELNKLNKLFKIYKNEEGSKILKK